MKTLLIDNGSTLTKSLAKLSPGEETIISYDEIPDSLDEWSLVILSGSSEFPVQGSEKRLKKEIELIRTTNLPVVGICLGHELIGHSFGASVVELGAKATGFTDVEVLQQHEIFMGRQSFEVWENHRYAIKDCPPDIIPLAKSRDGIAVFKHKKKPIYGFQFHPEHHSDQQFGDEVFKKLFGVLTGGVY